MELCPNMKIVVTFSWPSSPGSIWKFCMLDFSLPLPEWLSWFHWLLKQAAYFPVHLWLLGRFTRSKWPYIKMWKRDKISDCKRWFSSVPMTGCVSERVAGKAQRLRRYWSYDSTATCTDSYWNTRSLSANQQPDCSSPCERIYGLGYVSKVRDMHFVVHTVKPVNLADVKVGDCLAKLFWCLKEIFCEW